MSEQNRIKAKTGLEEGADPNQDKVEPLDPSHFKLAQTKPRRSKR